MLEQGATRFKPATKVKAVPLPVRRMSHFLASRSRSFRGQRQRLTNLALLVASLGLGQGVIFVSQSVLIAQGRYDLLADFGVHYSFAVLGIMLVDAGASTTLARMMAGLSREAGERAHVWQVFCETSVIRFVIAALIGLCAVLYVLYGAGEGFSRSYVMSALPGLLLWAFNGVGLLDGLRRSGVSGVSGALAYVATAIGLLIAAHEPASMAGAVLGAAFSIGYGLTLALQWLALARAGWSPRFPGPTKAGVVRSARNAFALSFQLVPGQVIGRAQILLSVAYLGAETTALFVYAKQIVSALTQIVAFVQRVEFPGLVEKLRAVETRTSRSIVGAQAVALYCAFALTAGMIGVAALAAMLPSLGLHRTAVVLAIFAPTVLTVSLSLVMIQGLAALGDYALIAWALVISAASGIAVSFLLISWLGIAALVVGEIVFHLVSFGIISRYLRHSWRVSAA